MNLNGYFTSRRTVRRFSDRAIDPELLSQLVEEASHAPNTGNMQLYSVVVTRSPELRRQLAPMHFNQPCVMECRALLTFCIDMNRFARWCDVSDAEAGFDNLQMLMAAAIDCSMFAQQFNTAAEMRGLGGCFLGTTAYNAEAIAKALECPDGVVPLIALALGYPCDDALESPAQDRLPVEAVMMSEKYRRFTDEDLRRLYAEKEARDDNRRFVAENAKSTLAQVFTQVRYPRESNEAFSVSLKAFLARYLR
jgi:nitroreductase